jgi:CheY-like chemotaxis protein
MIDQNRPLNILLVEDNPMDVLMTTEALQYWRIKTQLHVVEDGEQALDFLYRRGDYRGAERPDLIFLDLNLPKLSGNEVLSLIKRDPDLSSIIVVIVTTADGTIDFHMCDNFDTKLFITKPVDYEEYVQAICSVQELWITPPE